MRNLEIPKNHYKTTTSPTQHKMDLRGPALLWKKTTVREYSNTSFHINRFTFDWSWSRVRIAVLGYPKTTTATSHLKICNWSWTRSRTKPHLIKEKVKFAKRAN